MSGRRDPLPQLGGRLFLTDGGIETTLIFLDGLDLPHFASFTLRGSPDGEAALRRYFRSYAEVARRHGTGLILETATWRASADWGARLGCSGDDLAEANRWAVRMADEVRRELSSARTPVVVSGCVGPRGDGYVPGAEMSSAEARDYHRPQVRELAAAGADMIGALTLNYAAEAVGIARAAADADVPVAISFTVETDGRLPTGQSLREALEQVDAETSGRPAYFMVNCAHPAHLAPALESEGPWLARLRGFRANASRKSHAELNDATELDVGDPAGLARECAGLVRRLPALNVLGGCCGTDHRHADLIAAACAPLLAARG